MNFLRLIVEEVSDLGSYFMVRCVVTTKTLDITSGSIVSLAVERYIGEQQRVGEHFLLPQGLVIDDNI